MEFYEEIVTEKSANDEWLVKITLEMDESDSILWMGVHNHFHEDGTTYLDNEYIDELIGALQRAKVFINGGSE